MTIRSHYFGFTVIEVMLVLAITGALAVGVLAGVQSNITSQRYNDSINSFQAFLQDQYHQVGATSIQLRTSDPVCNPGSTDGLRGRTSCFVVGRLLVTNYGHGTGSDKASAVTWDVVASGLTKQIIDESKTVTDLFSKPEVRASIDATTRSEHQLAWDANLRKPAPNGNQEARWMVLILKSPASGSILTYITSYDGSEIKQEFLKSSRLMTMITDNNLTQEATFCVAPKGFSFLTKRAVVIRANGSNASAVEIAPLDETVNKVSPVKC